MPGSTPMPEVARSERKPVIEITNEPLDPEAITATVRRDSNGAVVTFLGTTRDFSQFG